MKMINIEKTPLYISAHSLVDSLIMTLEGELGQRYGYRDLTIINIDGKDLLVCQSEESYMGDKDRVVEVNGKKVMAKDGKHPLIDLFKSINYW